MTGCVKKDPKDYDSETWAPSQYKDGLSRYGDFHFHAYVVWLVGHYLFYINARVYLGHGPIDPIDNHDNVQSSLHQVMVIGGIIANDWINNSLNGRVWTQ